MKKGIVVAIYTAPAQGAPMQMLDQVQAIAGAGLEGDRYSRGEGSFNMGNPGKRQVTLINARFFEGSGFEYGESRRNLAVLGIELMWLIGREFHIGDVHMRGIKYNDPCMRPTKLSGKIVSFEDVFQDCGGLIAEILEGGIIKLGSEVIPPPRGY